MTHTLAYIDSAIAMNDMLRAIVDYERERLTCIIEGSMRTQAYARADRSSVTMYLNEISATSETLTMHLEAFTPVVGDCAYLSLTPIAQQITMGSLDMLRAVAQFEQDRAWADSFDEELDGNTCGDLRNLASQMMAQDTYLMGKAQDLNDSYIGVYKPVLS